MLANLGGIIMLKKIGVLLVVLILSMLTINVAFALPSNNESSNLEPKEIVTDTNIIKITSIDKVSTKVNKLGEKVGFKVKEDVIVDNRTIIEKDCKVFGTITKLNKAAAWKHDGNIEITFSEVMAKDGTAIPVEGVLKAYGKKPNFFVQYSLMGAFFKGKQISIKPGTEAILKINRTI